MDTAPLLLLLLLAQSATPGLAEEYHLVRQLKTWMEAQSYCRQYFRDLATINSEPDWWKVRELIGISGQDAWIGLYDDANSWRWSMDNSYVYDGDTTFSGSRVFPWADNHMGNQKCGGITNGNIDDRNCPARLLPLCYDAVTDTYIPATSTMSWEDALAYCRQTYTDLANMRTPEEETKAMSVIDTTRSYWIGMKRDSWEWSDQSDVSFTSWISGEPNSAHHYCTSATVDGWQDVLCTLQLPFVCSGPSKKVLNVVVKAASSVDLNDPKIQESILNYMEKQIGDQQLPHKFKLRWMKQPDGKVFNQTKPEL